RLLIQHKNPYFYKWQDADSVKLLDPRDNPHSEVNRVTVPPTVLQLFAPLSLLKYSTIRQLWLILQWIMFLAAIMIFSGSVQNKTTKRLIWICSLFFIGTSFFWRLHVERGQIYIFYVFLFGLFYWFFAKKSDMIAGILLGLLIALRPTFIIVIIPLLLLKKWKLSIFSVIGICLTICLSILISGWDVWANYLTAMDIHGQNHLLTVPSPTSFYPYTNIEGIGNLYSLANIPIYDTSIQYLMNSLGVPLGSGALKISLLVFTAIMSFFILKFRAKINDVDLMIISSLLVYLVEFFIPAARFSYNNVIVLVPLCLFIIKSAKILE
ncbi:MAG TPA: glycosyltransferase 87 family protein, partial [Candidatus Cloacimonadota bacterium]|nr:glycosyltransferase 87 family protein [Candidatus Cloacimonadota bacterium]